MSIATVDLVCDLPENLAFLSPGEIIPRDHFGGIYGCEMSRKMGHNATLSTDEANIFNEDPDEVML